MTVEKTVRHLMLTYPSLYKTRWDVLQHVLVCNGTGYEWRNGQAVQTIDHEDNKIAESLQDGVDRLWKTHFNPNKLLESGLNFTIEYAKKSLDTLLKIEENIFIFEPSSITKISKYYFVEWAPIFNQPADIQEDWKSACDQMLSWFEKEYHAGNLSEHDSKILLKYLEKQNG